MHPRQMTDSELFDEVYEFRSESTSYAQEVMTEFFNRQNFIQENN